MPQRRRFLAIAATWSALGPAAAMAAPAPQPVVWKGVTLGALASMSIVHPDRAHAQALLTRSLAEIELITATAAMLSKILSEVNMNEFTIHINDRRMLAAAALSAGFEQEEIGGALISLDKFDKIGLDGIEKDLLESGYAPEKVEIPQRFRKVVTWRGPIDNVYMDELMAVYGRKLRELSGM